MSANSEPETKAGYHHGDLRRALLLAAIDIIRTDGIEKLSLRGVAKRAGVSHAAPYRHFTNKRDLISCVAASGFRALEQAIVTQIAAEQNPLTQMELFCIAYVLFARRQTDQFRLMFGVNATDNDDHEELAAAANDVRQRLLDVVGRCQEQGLIREGRADDICLAAWSLSHGLAVLVVEGQIEASDDDELRQIARTTASTLFIGLRPFMP